ncbi:TPR repeat-containing protein [Marinibactrum halimedae]|uniref:TPR repeat-containing protein n=1 Tax=Marinibactrum halimedae TaxID=1444977 RepID=A0AA37T813_9GAMM|nr:TPR repeat-containing protein [Marinibactrum halimedae]
MDIADNTPPQKNDTDIVEKTYKPFEPETFYSLLVAELAGNRQRYDIALGNYIQQAHKTRDAGVTARATRIARFLGANQAALSTAVLWTEIDPENSEARLIAASELAQSGQLQPALGHAKHLLSTESTTIFQSIAARAAQATDTQRESLLTEYNNLLQEYPDSIEIRIGKGLLLQQQGKLKEGLALARDVLKEDPDNVSAATLETKLLQQLGRTDEAIERLVRMLDSNPTDKRLRLQYARLLADFDLGQAKEQFVVLTEQNPDDDDLLFSLALICHELGQTDEAVSHFTTLQSSPSRASAANYYLGEIYRKAGNFDLALEHYAAVLPGQDFIPALTKRSDILLKMGKSQAVFEQFNQLRIEYPQERERLYLIQADLLATHKRYEPAATLLTEALTEFPQSSAILYSRAMVNEQLGYLDRLEADLREIIKYDSTNASALNALGYTLANKTTRYQEAYELIRQALSLKPDDPAIIDSMGWVQYKLGNYDDALLRLREAMKAYPDHEVAAHLGEVLWVMGEQNEARQIWQKGLELNPNSELIPAVMKRLEAQ